MEDWRGDLLKIGIIPDDMPDQTNFVLFNLDELANHMIKELDKAREEGRKYALKEVEYMLAKDTRYEFLFTEIKDILSKLTTK